VVLLLFVVVFVVVFLLVLLVFWAEASLASMSRLSRSSACCVDYR